METLPSNAPFHRLLRGDATAAENLGVDARRAALRYWVTKNTRMARVCEMRTLADQREREGADPAMVALVRAEWSE
jgi:hypothetical protein